MQRGSASVAVKTEKRATKSDNIKMLFSETETAKQNQKFPFHSFFRFAAEGWGEETREKCKEIFWFLHTRVRERVRGAHHWSSGFNSKYIRTSFNTHRRFCAAKAAGGEVVPCGTTNRDSKTPPIFFRAYPRRKNRRGVLNL
jgi:hypothetical protein